MGWLGHLYKKLFCGIRPIYIIIRFSKSTYYLIIEIAFVKLYQKYSFSPFPWDDLNVLVTVILSFLFDFIFKYFVISTMITN